MTKVINPGEIEYDETEFYMKLFQELRTHLTIIGGYAALLAEDNDFPLNEEQKEKTNQILDSYKKMNIIVNDVTDLVRLKEGEVSLHAKEIDLRYILNDVIDDIKPLLTEKDVTMEVSLPSEPMMIIGDVEFLTKAIFHILEHDISYLFMNSKIKITTLLKDKIWEIIFRDNGPGFPLEEIPNLFKPFHMLNFLGKEVGLGLIVAKKIANLHKGRLWIESKPEQGTTIHLSLPVKKEVEKRKVLIIEDNLVIARMWEAKLKLEFFVMLANSGRDGIEKAKIFEPDVVLLDILMPGMDGFEVCKQMKNLPSLKDTPIIFLSNLAQEHMLDKVKELGAVDYIPKSTINPTILSKKIKEHIKPLESEGFEKNVSPATDSSSE